MNLKVIMARKEGKEAKIILNLTAVGKTLTIEAFHHPPAPSSPWPLLQRDTGCFYTTGSGSGVATG